MITITRKYLPPGLSSVAVFLLGLVCPASGSTIISTIPSVPQCCGEAIGNPPNAQLQMAIRFVPDGTFLLDSVIFDLGESFGNGLIVGQIYSEEDGLPGTLLDSLTAAVPAPPSGGLFTITAQSPFVLQSGVAYWLTGIDTDPDSGAYWWYSDQLGWRAAVDLPGHPQPGFPTWGNANGGGPAGPGTNQSLVLAFELDGTPTPEPGTASLIGLASMALLLLRKPHRRLRDVGRGNGVAKLLQTPDQ